MKLYKRPSSGRVEAHDQGIGIESFIVLCLLAILPIVLSAVAMYGLRNNSIKGTFICYVILERLSEIMINILNGRGFTTVF